MRLFYHSVTRGHSRAWSQVDSLGSEPLKPRNLSMEPSSLRCFRRRWNIEVSRGEMFRTKAASSVASHQEQITAVRSGGQGCRVEETVSFYPANTRAASLQTRTAPKAVRVFGILQSCCRLSRLATSSSWNPQIRKHMDNTTRKSYDKSQGTRNDTHQKDEGGGGRGADPREPSVRTKREDPAGRTRGAKKPGA